MAQILVRNLNQRVVDRLKERAKRQGRSLQAEVKRIIESAAASERLDAAAARELSAKLRRRLKGREFGDAATLIRKDRER